MKKIDGIFLFLLVVVLFSWRMGDDTLNSLWMSRWWVLVMGSSIAFFMFLRTGHDFWWKVPVLASTVLGGLTSTFFFKRYDFDFYKAVLSLDESCRNYQVDPTPLCDTRNFQMALRQATAMSALACICLMVLVLVAHKSGHIKRMLYVYMGLGSVGTSLIIICSPLFGKNPEQWVELFDNPSMAASFAAVASIPFFHYIHKNLKWGRGLSLALAGVTLLAVVLTNASVPMLCFLSGYGTYALARWVPWRRIPAFDVGLFVAVVSYVAVCMYKYLPRTEWLNNFTNSNGRLSTWTWAIDFWAAQDWSIILFGWGPGAWRVIFPILQIDHGQDTGWWFYAHNDFLQMLVDQGIVGLSALLLLCGGLLWSARNSPHMLATLVAFGTMMMFNFPLHWPVHALLGALLVGVI